jgi:hypothetical protein
MRELLHKFRAAMEADKKAPFFDWSRVRQILLMLLFAGVICAYFGYEFGPFGPGLKPVVQKIRTRIDTIRTRIDTATDKDIVAEGGGIWVGYMDAPNGGERLVLFISPQTGATLTLSHNLLTRDNVRRKIEYSDRLNLPRDR